MDVIDVSSPVVSYKCLNCGLELSLGKTPPYRCPECHHKIFLKIWQLKFCPFCGKEVTSVHIGGATGYKPLRFVHSKVLAPKRLKPGISNNIHITSLVSCRNDHQFFVVSKPSK